MSSTQICYERFAMDFFTYFLRDLLIIITDVTYLFHRFPQMEVKISFSCFACDIHYSERSFCHTYNSIQFTIPFEIATNTKFVLTHNFNTVKLMFAVTLSTAFGLFILTVTQMYC